MKQNHGVVAMPADAPELVKQLTRPIMRAALDGDFEVHCVNCERLQRAQACFLVMCSLLATVNNPGEIIDDLSKAAKVYVEQNCAGLREIEAMISASGMTPEELLEAAASDLDLEEIPPEPTEH